MAFFRRQPPKPDSLRKAETGTSSSEPSSPASRPVAPPPETPSFLKEPDLRTSLGEDAVVTGKLSFTTPTRIDGTLKGEIRCTKLLVVGPTAVVDGQVDAEDLRVHGRIESGGTKANRVEILPDGRLTGRLETQTLVIHDGGFFDGECSMGADGDTGNEKRRAGGRGR